MFIVLYSDKSFCHVDCNSLKSHLLSHERFTLSKFNVEWFRSRSNVKFSLKMCGPCVCSGFLFFLEIYMELAQDTPPYFRPLLILLGCKKRRIHWLKKEMYWICNQKQKSPRLKSQLVPASSLMLLCSLHRIKQPLLS